MKPAKSGIPIQVLILCRVEDKNIRNFSGLDGSILMTRTAKVAEKFNLGNEVIAAVYFSTVSEL